MAPSLHTRILLSRRASIFAHARSKNFACSAQCASALNTSRAEPCGAGIPARKRAASLTLTGSAACNAPASAHAMRKILLSMVGTITLTRLPPLRRSKIHQQPEKHRPEARERFDRLEARDLQQHEKRDGQEKKRRDRVAPRPVRARQRGPAEAENEHAEHRQERAERETELDVRIDPLKARGGEQA